MEELEQVQKEVDTQKEVDRRKRKRKVIARLLTALLMLVVAAASSFITLGVSTYLRVKKGGTYTITQEYYDYLVRYKRLFEVEKLLKEDHLYEVDDQDYVDYAIKGLTAAMQDRYTVYMTPDEYQETMKTDSGEQEGLGVLLSKSEDDAMITIVRVYSGSPAEQAGLMSGDQVIAADGTSVVGMELSDAVQLMRGEIGTQVTLRVLRGNQTLDITVTRNKFTADRVNARMLEDNIGYIQILEFTGNARDRFNEELDKMIEADIDALVIDLRDNPGGYLTDVCQMTDRLLPAGTIVYTEKRDGTRETQTSDADCVDFPIVVLVNGNSASASEIMTGALQDYGLATVVGTQTFGKGLVQVTVPFVSDGAALKYTFAQYFTPNGRNINGVGIEPDEIVELPEGLNTYLMTDEEDTQLQAGLKILREKLGIEQEELPLAG